LNSEDSEVFFVVRQLFKEFEAHELS